MFTRNGSCLMFRPVTYPLWPPSLTTRNSNDYHYFLTLTNFSHDYQFFRPVTYLLWQPSLTRRNFWWCTGLLMTMSTTNSPWCWPGLLRRPMFFSGIQYFLTLTIIFPRLPLFSHAYHYFPTFTIIFPRLPIFYNQQSMMLDRSLEEADVLFM